jgi:hypothetical protein
VLRWTTLEKVPRVGAVRRWLYLALALLDSSGLDICGGIECSTTCSPKSPSARLPGAQARPMPGYEVEP